MSAEKAIIEFYKQFEYEPVIENAENLQSKEKWIICGMGGSHLAADLLKIFQPRLEIIIHFDYGLPEMSAEDLNQYLIIASSYSGNTEETLDSFGEALKKKLSLAAISVGGKLLESAKKNSIPFVQLPDTGIQPRFALGFSLRAILKLMGDKKNLAETQKLARLLDNQFCQKAGQELAQKIKGCVPVIYASRKNKAIAYNWKIKFNETAKIPAFYNIFPELNHNEMTGFDAKETTKSLSDKFYFIFLLDSGDHPRILKRMDLTSELLKKRGYKVEILELAGQNSWHKIFSNLLIADWTTYYTALNYGTEPEFVPMVEEFKKLMQ
ncbi:MAG: bifunctional phosphoglucose/phosphomannose isomerase [Patescibacteria group bacterium]